MSLACWRASGERYVPADATPLVCKFHPRPFSHQERNFWLSFFCFTLWCLLAAFYRLQVQLLALEDQLAANGDDFSVPPRKPVQPSAPPLSHAADGKPATKKDA